MLERRLSDAGLTVTGRLTPTDCTAPYWWLKCAVGVDNDSHPLVKAYHRLLVWDITSRPLPTRVAEAILTPIMGKSLVVYAKKVG